MKRRNFLSAAALTGLSLTIPLSSRRARAQSAAYGGPYFVFVDASGGWDPRFLYDPTLDVTQNRIYTTIESAGAISYGPIPLDLGALDVEPDSGAEAYLLTAAQFAQRHGGRLTVINGVDMETNNHDAGSRAIWSGQLAEGYPSIGALIAAAHAPELPMGFLSTGGYDATAGIVPLTRVADAGNMRRLAKPNLLDPANSEIEGYHGPATWGMIQQLQAERLAELAAGQHLPRAKTSMSELTLARSNDDMLSALVIPESLIEAPYYGGNLTRNMQQAQIAISAFSSGIAACLNLSIGGFDTHGNHDTDQPARIVEVLTLVDFVLAEAERAGLADRIYVFVGSDFARGPFYNGDQPGDGKDHWPIGSFLALGPTIPGNRVIGATTPEQLARNVDPATLGVVDSGGVKITAAHIQGAIRRLAGAAELGDELFPLPGQPLPLFG